ncbi:MAG TPA: DUF1015 domain-containing protein [Phaeodactylibacter sp.]|nr:DUF1015 domain-containing protein [Phaeodactylibacter sp.]
MIIRPFQAVYPNTDYIASNDTFFGTVKEEYVSYKKSGFYIKASQESVYIYRIQTPHRTHTGLLACTDINEYLKDNIKKHENTLPAGEQRQMYMMMNRKSIVKPVLLIHPKVKKLNDLFEKYIKENEPFYVIHFESENTKHILWEVNDGDSIEKIQQIFNKKIPKSYIADGHHRCAATALLYSRLKKKKKLNPYENILTAFFPEDQLEIYDYNRIVDALGEVSLTQFMAKLSKLFYIDFLEKPAKPKSKHEITMFLNKEWFLLKWKPSVLKKYKNKKIVLDASLLDENVLNKILGIKDVKTDARMKYISGTESLKSLINKTQKSATRVAFCLFPAQMSDLLTTADEGGVMPPKSTWFEPRMKNGLIVQDLAGI